MRGQNAPQMLMFYTLDIGALIPADHPLHALKKCVDAKLHGMRQDISIPYSHISRPGIPAEQLIKATLLQALDSICSERQLCEQLRYNIYRWFIASRSRTRPLATRSSLKTARALPSTG